jgi:hypothetical protein
LLKKRQLQVRRSNVLPLVFVSVFLLFFFINPAVFYFQNMTQEKKEKPMFRVVLSDVGEVRDDAILGWLCK